jgi:Zn-dependent protease
MFPRFPSYRLGTLLGFPIRVNLSFLLLLLVVLFWAGGVPGLAIALMVAASVIVHELGHAVVARRLGVPVSGIELHFFGGAAGMAGMPRRPVDEIAVAAAGPAVSLAIAAVAHAAAALLGSPVLALLGTVNLVLGVFNLLPAFPSDGGRILRAWLARRRGLVRATETAVKVGRAVCIALAVAGLFTSFQLVVVAAVLWMMGTAERAAARRRGDGGEWQGQGPARVEYLPPPRGGRGWPATPPVVRRVVIWPR